MDYAKNLKLARKWAGLTQAELAKKAGIATITVRQYEAGNRKPTMENWFAIADALHLSLDELNDAELLPTGPFDPSLDVDLTDFPPAGKQGSVIAADVIKRAGLTLKDKDGNVIHQGDDRKWRKMSDAEAYRAGFLQFHSEEDRIVYFYKQLTDEGKVAVGGCFFQHLDKGALSEVADYVMNLSENPLYQRPPAPESPQTPQEGKATPPPKRPKEGQE